MTALVRYLGLVRVGRGWKALSLARQFLLAGAAVLLAGMTTIGFWVTQQIEQSVTRNTAAATALYVDSVIAPLLPDIRQDPTLSEGARRALDETLGQGALGARLSSFRIWGEDGMVAYSSEPALIGKRFPPGETLRKAWAGQVAAEFDNLEDEESGLDRPSSEPLLEIYSPIRAPWSGEVVAVAEFYESAQELEDALRDARLRSWFVVAAVTLGMMGLLFGIVSRGSGVIRAQRQALEGRVEELSTLLRANQELRRRVQGASGRAAAVNERYLKRISADLHDGPAQLLALASLRMGSARLEHAGALEAEELKSIRGYLDDAMGEIRGICRGLALPQLERMGLAELLRSAVLAHEQRTRSSVTLSVPDGSPALTQTEKICTFRFVQEGLSNAFRHAAGAGQSVAADFTGSLLYVTVADRGPGFSPGSGSDEGLGLAGLRERVESLGGEFLIESTAAGTKLSMTLKLGAGETL
jgi:signal transduction histidine kinase